MWNFVGSLFHLSYQALLVDVFLGVLEHLGAELRLAPRLGTTTTHPFEWADYLSILLRLVRFELAIQLAHSRFTTLPTVTRIS